MPANPAHFYKLGGPTSRKVADVFLSIAQYGVRVHTRTTVPHNAFYPGRKHTRRAGRSQAAGLG